MSQSLRGAAWTEPFDLAVYYPIFIYLAVIIGFAIATMIVAHIVGPPSQIRRQGDAVRVRHGPDRRRPAAVRRQVLSDRHHVSGVRRRIAVSLSVGGHRLSRTAAWPEVTPTRSGRSFWSVLVFIALLLVAYIYDWRKGVFQWR